VCPNLAFQTYRQKPLALTVPHLVVRDGRVVTERTTSFRVEQRFQVLVLSDFCNECGNCVTFCPTAGRPWRDKPRLYLDRGEFEAQSDNAFRLFHDHHTWWLQARWAGQTHEVELNHDLRYRAPGWRLELEAKSFALRKAQVEPGVVDGRSLSLENCARMYALLRGVRDSSAFLPMAPLTDRSDLD
jgi:putative selenate reductase